MLALGIDIGGSSTKLALLRDGQTAWTGQSGVYNQPQKQDLVNAIRQAVGTRIKSIDAVGVCVPGLLDAGGSTVTLAVNLPALTGIPLKQLVAESIAVDVPRLKVVNDAHAAAVDIISTRALDGRSIVFALGTGVGMAVLEEGKPLLIEGNSAGHIGQADVSIELDAPIGPDGGAGSLEAYIGVAALMHRYGSMDEFYRVVHVTDPPMRALARAIRICHAIYRPAHVVLAGGVGVRLGRLMAALKQLIDTHLTSIARAGWTLSTAADDFHAARGAARLADLMQD